MNRKKLEPASVTMELGEANFDLEILKAELPALVLFWAPWSQPCVLLKRVVEEVAAGCAGKVKVARVNVDDNPDLGVLYAIQSIPTLLFFAQGNVRARIVGTVSKEAIFARMKSFRFVAD
jgi:thioredoxin 1